MCKLGCGCIIIFYYCFKSCYNWNLHTSGLAENASPSCVILTIEQHKHWQICPRSMDIRTRVRSGHTSHFSRTRWRRRRTHTQFWRHPHLCLFCIFLDSPMNSADYMAYIAHNARIHSQAERPNPIFTPLTTHTINTNTWLILTTRVCKYSTNGWQSSRCTALPLSLRAMLSCRCLFAMFTCIHLALTS
jgi:hypothetical protein